MDFEPAAALTEEELAQRREQAAQLSKATRTVAFTLDDEPSQVHPSNVSCALPLIRYGVGHQEAELCAPNHTPPLWAVAHLHCHSCELGIGVQSQGDLCSLHRLLSHGHLQFCFAVINACSLPFC